MFEQVYPLTQSTQHYHSNADIGMVEFTTFQFQLHHLQILQFRDEWQIAASPNGKEIRRL